MGRFNTQHEVDRFLEILPCAIATLTRPAIPSQQSITDRRSVVLA
jgi:hypothetical protein